MNLKKSGAPTVEELHLFKVFPEEEVLRKGPVAMLECIEEIPCNPCEVSCPHHAIYVGKPITRLPVIDADRCKACLACVAACPGLCILVRDKYYDEEHSSVAFPWEYFPLPQKGSIVSMVNRQGEVLCQGEILRVVNPPAYQKTAVVLAKFPREYFYDIVSMQRPK